MIWLHKQPGLRGRRDRAGFSPTCKPRPPSTASFADLCDATRPFSYLMCKNKDLDSCPEMRQRAATQE
ncbi:hypothetical protein RMHFA_04633 [Roseomonas mucosa]|uniref:Uncharacterized protein n=1 Tax=Roseomonas mucosa TaxID=207340 RepID=A0A4Y1N3B3_9PROT|nr:hypothetical protein RADP37_04633 [Roseomonas mucosa]QDD96411.1 hypothetical protein HVIM_04633 [Roseomonas mucosa]QDE01412.1 hypothetical protein ADP8_04633 [Roseomonas mucosa]UZO93699.1 hypothetical protein RMP42_04633 [Roseomonas mucosa]UZO98456.1 hypothetical protein RMHFA_04633 [Roseomonas mucosa]